MKKSLFYYELPAEFIAQKPLEKRDSSKLLLLDRKTGRTGHGFFYSLQNYLKNGDVLVVNESRVMKCRLEGTKEKTGAKIECFILKKLDDTSAEVLIKPSRKLDTGSRVNVGKYFFEITQKKPYGKATASFNGEVETVIGECGMVPLPPYIKNRDISAERYQTVYAEKNGSAAAPTAGLHFTEATIASLKSRGVVFAKVSLDIGLDTFRPIVEDDIEDHVIHSENFHIDANEAAKISEARKAGNRIIAVGTTSMRVIETVFDENGGISEYSGSTSLYIYPGYRFKIADALLTNFHLPYSTLLVMVSAFAGRENILRAYEEAKAGNYRFFSFGDCMFIY